MIVQTNKQTDKQRLHFYIYRYTWNIQDTIIHYRYIDNRIQDEKYMIRIQNTDNIIQDKE